MPLANCAQEMQKSTGSDQGAVAGSAEFAVRKARNGAAIRWIINERKGLWVLKKSLNRTSFHLRACRRRFSCLRWN